MSLDYDTTKCAIWDADTLHGEKLTKDSKGAIANTFIWSTLTTGIGEITEANAGEAHKRMAFYECVIGPWMNKTDEDGRPEPFPITREVVDLMVGLKTNVFPKTTDAKFLKNLYQFFNPRN